jgi:hypothetical protein
MSFETGQRSAIRVPENVISAGEKSNLESCWRCREVKQGHRERAGRINQFQARWESRDQGMKCKKQGSSNQQKSKVLSAPLQLETRFDCQDQSNG